MDAARWPHAVWWSFYEGDNQFDRFLRETLDFLTRSLRRRDISSANLGPRQQADLLLDLLRQPGILLILDGFERALRAFSSMMAGIRGTRYRNQGTGDRSQTALILRHPSFVIPTATASPPSPSTSSAPWLPCPASRQGVDDDPAAAADFGMARAGSFGGLLRAGADADGTGRCGGVFPWPGHPRARAEIEAACAPSGYHPLSLRLLAGLIANDLRQPGDIAAARRLDVSGDLIQRQHHVLEQAYESLTADRRRLLSRIACFRGPVGYEALAALADDGRGEARPRPRKRTAERTRATGRVAPGPGHGLARPPLPRPAPPRPQNQSL